MVLVEDAGNLLAVLADGQQRLLVVVGGNVEHEQVAAANGGGEDTGIGVKSTANIAVGAVEGQVLLAATVVGLASVGVEVDTEGLVGQPSEELVLLHHASSQVLDVALSVLVVRIHARLKNTKNSIKPSHDLYEAFLKRKNSISSVVIEIFSLSQQNFTAYIVEF